MTRKHDMDAATALRIIFAEALQACYYREIKAGIREPLPANSLSSSMKQRVLEAYDHRCGYCGATANLEIDHIWPRCKGGQHWMVNLQPLCSIPCHKDKGTNLELRSPEALAVLLRSLGPLGGRLARWALLVVAWIVRVVVAHPYATAVVGGAYFATRWLREREEEDGEMRYQRIGRTVKDVARTRAADVREGATNMARGLVGRAGSVRVPRPRRSTAW